MEKYNYNGKELKSINVRELPTQEMVDCYSNVPIWLFEDENGKVYEFECDYPEEQELMYIYNSWDEFIADFENL